MTRLTVLLLLILPSCVSRTVVGSEPVPAPDDAGASTTFDAAGDASPDEEQEATRDFEQDLIGTWQGELERLGVTLTIQFKPRSIYATCNEGQCTDAGLYFVTDQLSNQHFAGELQSRAGQRRSELNDMWIEGNVLRFVITNGFIASEAVLTKLP